MLVLVVRAVHIGSGLEQQIEHVAPLCFDGHVQRLRAAAPERMGTDGIDHRRRRCKDAADLIDLARADELQKPLNDLVSSR